MKKTCLNFKNEIIQISKRIFSYLSTYVKWKSNRIIENYIRKRLPLSFFIFIIIALSLHMVIPNNNNDLSKYVVFLKDEHLRDEIIISAITKIVGSFTILISLLSAIYVFTYREQKSISPSGSTDVYKNTLVSIVMIFMILNIIFVWLISIEYSRLLNAKGYTSSLSITEYLFYKIVLIGVTFSILIILIFYLIKYLFKTMSVDQMLSDSVNQTFKILKVIYYSYRTDKFTGLLNENYRKFHFSLESVFQNLKFAADNNMNKEFEENINKFKNVFKFFNEEILYKENKIHISTYLLNEDDTKFSQAYQSAIRGNLSLIANLLKNQHYNKAKTLVSLYIEMYNENDVKLVKIYKKSLIEFLDIIDVNDERQIAIYVGCLNALPEYTTHVAYNFLLMKLVNKNQLKNLTNVVYTFKNNIRDKKRYTIAVVIIIIQNLIKSIEISDQAITGFLVKYLFTNFSGKEVSRALKSLNRKPKSYTSVLEGEESIKGINESESYAIVSNDETFSYCFKKAFILLYAQNLFAVQQGLWYIDEFTTGEEIDLKKEFEDCDYSEYILSKVKVNSDKYGLLFFENERVMRNVYENLNLRYPEKEKYKNDVSNVAASLVRKLFKL